MTASRWTVATVRSPFSPAAQPTGFEGDWKQADAEAMRIQATNAFHEVWIVTTLDVDIPREGKRPLRIAPTQAQRDAAKLRAIKVRTLLSRAESAPQLLDQVARRIGIEGDREAIASALVGMDWTWDTVTRACS